MQLLDSLSVSANKDSINPEMVLSVTLQFQRYLELPIDITGIILSEDDKKLTTSSFAKPEQNQNLQFNAFFNQNDRTMQDSKIQLFFNFNKKTLEYIEKKRHLNQKTDVNLKLQLKIRYLTSRMIISHVNLTEVEINNKQTRQVETQKLISYDSSRQGGIGYSDLWLISGDSRQTVFEMSFYEIIKPIKIPSSDWIHDYCPIYEIGNYFVVDLPLIDSIPKFNMDSSNSTDLNNFYEKYNAAIESLNEMYSELIKGEWNNTIEKSRKISELIRNENEIKELFIRNGYNVDAFNEFNASVKSLFNYASKFHHKLDAKSKKVLSDIKANREDAYLIYVTCLSILNSIAQKSTRLE